MLGRMQVTKYRKNPKTEIEKNMNQKKWEGVTGKTVVQLIHI